MLTTTHTRCDKHNVYINGLTISIHDLWKAMEKCFSGFLLPASECYTPFHELMPMYQADEIAEEFDFALIKQEFEITVYGYLIHGSMLVMRYSEACGEPDEPYELIEVTKLTPLN